MRWRNRLKCDGEIGCFYSSANTWLLLQGVDPKTVMERLGHAKVATTLELYGHVLPGRDAAAAQAFAEAASMAGGTP